MHWLHVNHVKLFHNHFSFRRRPTEIIWLNRAETRLKLFHIISEELFSQLMNIFQRV